MSILNHTYSYELISQISLYYIIVYHVILYQHISYYIISYCIILYHITYHVISYLIISYYTISCVKTTMSSIIVVHCIFVRTIVNHSIYDYSLLWVKPVLGNKFAQRGANFKECDTVNPKNVRCIKRVCACGTITPSLTMWSLWDAGVILNFPFSNWYQW